MDKDRVFALLGIAEEADVTKHGADALRLDYSKSSTETSMTTTKFLIKHHQSLDVLKMVEHHPEDEIERPTWVPPRSEKEFFRSTILGEMDDKAGFHPTNNVPLQIEESDDPTELCVHGQRLDRHPRGRAVPDGTRVSGIFNFIYL